MEESMNNVCGDETGRFEVHYAKSQVWLGIICDCVFAALLVRMVVDPNSAKEVWRGIVFILFMILGVVVILIAARWRIQVSGDTITERPVVGREKTYQFSDMTKAVRKPNTLHVYSGNKRLFVMDYACVGAQLLIKRLEAESIPFEENNK